MQLNTPDTCADANGTAPRPFIKNKWLRINFLYGLMGIGIGLVLTVLLSANAGAWIGLHNFIFEMVFSVVITLFITNCIYIAQKYLTKGMGKSLKFILLYYGASLVGMFLAIESIHLALSFIFHTHYTFFHKQDFVFSLFVMLIVCTLLYVREVQGDRFRSRLKEKELDVLRLTELNTRAELAALQARVNPHFLYNSLNSIASLIHEDPAKAEIMTLKLSNLFRYTINQEMEHLVTVREEMEIVNTYLDIEKVRFGDRIRFGTTIDPALLQAKIPRFMIQPLVENALKHGLRDTVQNGELHITIMQEEKIEIAVSDNGVPFAPDYEMGYGLQSTYDKLALLYPGNYELYIRNEPVKEVRILIPRNDA